MTSLGSMGTNKSLISGELLAPNCHSPIINSISIIIVWGLGYVKLLIKFNPYETNISNVTKILEERHLCELRDGVISKEN